jgi:hypothetical protein
VLELRPAVLVKPELGTLLLDPSAGPAIDVVIGDCPTRL